MVYLDNIKVRISRQLACYIPFNICIFKNLFTAQDISVYSRGCGKGKATGYCKTRTLGILFSNQSKFVDFLIRSKAVLNLSQTFQTLRDKMIEKIKNHETFSYICVNISFRV